MSEAQVYFVDKKKAACRGQDTKLFFADSGPLSNPSVRKAVTHAKSLCKGCDVQAECLIFAVNNDEEFGIWGGFTRKERKKFFGESAKISYDKAMRAVKWTRSF